MVSLLLVSHSEKIAGGTREFVAEMAGDAEVVAVGGTKDGGFGADYDRILAELERLSKKGEVIVLADLGSAKLTAQMAAEALGEDAQKNVHCCDAALVEGAFAGAVAASSGMDALFVLDQLEDYLLPKG